MRKLSGLPILNLKLKQNQLIVSVEERINGEWIACEILHRTYRSPVGHR